MDSGNSSSMQSSSGGDPPDHHQEYDSTTTATTPLHFNFSSATPPPPHSHRHQHMPPHLLPQPPPTTAPLIHPHMMNINPTNVFLQQPFSDFTTTTSSWATTSPPPTSIDPGLLLLDPTYISFHAGPSSSSIEATTSPRRPPTGAPKNPRKRSRASRRAPTTVLTTDTTNFRAMVQEFTGIPIAPPFPGPSSPYSRLLSTSINRGSPTPFSRPSPQTPIFQTHPPDPFFSFLQHDPHQHQPAAGMGYQQLPITNAPYGPTDHDILRDSAIDPPPPIVVDQVMTSSSCGASTDLLNKELNAEQGKQQHK